MALISSQGVSFGGLSGLTNVKKKTTRPDPTSSNNQLDASTLALAHGSNRVYVDGLPDAGTGAVEGIARTVSVSFLAETAPVVGSTVTDDGTVYKCTESEVEYAVGELVKGTANYVSVPDEE